MAQVDIERGWLGDEKISKALGSLLRPGSPVTGAGPWSPTSHEQPIDHLVEQVVLVTDVAVKGHRRDAEVGCKTAHRHLLEVSGPNGPCGNVDDLFTVNRSPASALSPFGLCHRCTSISRIDLCYRRSLTCT